jgi:tetratricopeptide (TPR) repeat protein
VKGQFRSIDLMPTLLELAAVTSPPVTGASRARNLRTGTVIPDNESYAESLYGSIHFGYAPVRALRAEGFKYIDTPRAELYRVASDPVETMNLNVARASLSTAMQKQLRQIHGEDARRSAPVAPVDPVTQERLAALGYVAGGPSVPGLGSSQLPDPKDRLTQYQRYSRGINAALRARRQRDPGSVVKVLLPLAPEFGSKGTVSSFLGEALLETRRFTEALPFLVKARDASPTAWSRWGRLAEAYAGAGRLNDALDATEKGLAVSPRATTLIRLRVVLLTRVGRAAEATRFLEGASAANPQDGVLLAEVASSKRNAGDLPAAESLSGRALALAPQKAEVWLSRGLALAALGRSQEAAQALERAIQLDPLSADALFYAATIEIQAGRSGSALRMLDRVQELDPKRPGLSEVRAAARNARPASASSSTPPSVGSVRLLAIRCRSREQAKDALRRVAAGEDFSAVARNVSVDPSAARGGDLGWVRPGDLQPPLNAAARGLSPGAVSPVLEVQGGFVILKRSRQ